MENLRGHYRHSFPLRERLRVEIDTFSPPQTYVGEIIDLSLEGLKACFSDSSAPMAPGDRVLARYVIPGFEAPLQLPATVIYSQVVAAGHAYGIRFLAPLHVRTAEVRAKMINRFLLNAQRRALRKRWEGETVPNG